MSMAAVGLVRPKDPANVGGAQRAAHAYGASMVAIAGLRSKKPWNMANTSRAENHLPVMMGTDIRDLVPYGAVPVAVDLLDGAEELPRFIHPRVAFYIFGPEDGTLGKSVTDWCPRRVVVPTRFCMNLAATVNVVLYDRMSKERT